MSSTRLIQAKFTTTYLSFQWTFCCPPLSSRFHLACVASSFEIMGRPIFAAFKSNPLIHGSRYSWCLISIQKKKKKKHNQITPERYFPMKNKSCFKNKYIQNIHSKIASPKVPPCHCSMMLNIAPGFFMCWEGRKWTKNISNLFPAQTRVSSVDIYCRCASYVWIQAPVLHSFQPYTDRQSQSQNSSF